MSKKIIYTADAPKPVGPYSQAVQFGDTLYCSGQIAIDPKTDQVILGSIEEQTRLIMKNIQAVLLAANMDFSNVIKTTIFLTDMKDFATVNGIYAESFKFDPPARSTVAVAGLPKGVNVEIEVLARR